MDEQIERTLSVFYGSPEGFSTDDFYSEYVFFCEQAEVQPKIKAQVIREVCKQTGCTVEEKRVKYFRR